MSLDEHIIIHFITGKCSEEELRKVNEWLKENPSQAGNLFEMEEMYRSLQARGMAEVKIEKALSRVRRRTEESENDSSSLAIYLNLRRYVAAAMIALIAGLTVFWFENKHATPQEELITVYASDSITRQITLPDGSLVWLNKNATLCYPKVFANTERRVLLTGEGYFEIHKDQEHPFVVESKAMNVKVLGTKFNFKNDSLANCSEVSLMEGSVEVSSNCSNGNMVLSPGQKAHLDYHTGHITIVQTEHQTDASWHYRAITFNQATIKEIAQKLEAVYGITIKVSDRLIETSTYSGRVLQKEDPEEVFESLQYVLPIEHKKIKSTIYLWEPTARKR